MAFSNAGINNSTKLGPFLNEQDTYEKSKFKFSDPEDVTAFLLMDLFIAYMCFTSIYFPTSQLGLAAESKAVVKKDWEGSMWLTWMTATWPCLTGHPPKRNNVVWVKTETDEVRNIWELKKRGGMFCKTGKASFEESIPVKPTRILVMAESNADSVSRKPYLVEELLVRIKK